LAKWLKIYEAFYDASILSQLFRIFCLIRIHKEEFYPLLNDFRLGRSSFLLYSCKIHKLFNNVYTISNKD